jgi:hypothetical protein
MRCLRESELPRRSEMKIKITISVRLWGWKVEYTFTL